MQIIKEKLDIDDVLEKNKNIIKFLNIKSKIIKGNKTFLENYYKLVMIR